MQKRKAAIFGGSFSPVHTGHVKAAAAYLRASGADKIIIIPAKNPPHKELDGGASDLDRINMCKLAFSSEKELCGKIEMSEFELSRDSISYTIDTVEHFISLGYTDISLLIGTDMLLCFESWRFYKELLAKTTLYYIDRYHGEEITKTAICAEKLREKYGARVIALETEVFDTSSSEIRDLIKNGKSTDGILPLAVREYIDEKGLYR